MPAWTASAPGAETAGRYIGVKTVSVFPGNRDSVRAHSVSRALAHLATALTDP